MTYTKMQAYYAKEENKRECILHSHKDWHWVYFVCKPIEEKNEYIFMTEDGTFCTGIFNPFRCTYYVDDLYGCLTEDQVIELLPPDEIRDIYGYRREKEI